MDKMLVKIMKSLPKNMAYVGEETLLCIDLLGNKITRSFPIFYEIRTGKYFQLINEELGTMVNYDWFQKIIRQNIKKRQEV